MRLPFSSFAPVFRARTVRDAPPLDASAVSSLQLMLSKFEYDGGLNPSFRPGQFELPLESVTAYMAQPVVSGRVVVPEGGGDPAACCFGVVGLHNRHALLRVSGTSLDARRRCHARRQSPLSRQKVPCSPTNLFYVTPCAAQAPRFVLVSSAGVTRPNRPGIDVEQEPPAVKMNDALGGILTFKLKGEEGRECARKLPGLPAGRGYHARCTRQPRLLMTCPPCWLRVQAKMRCVRAASRTRWCAPWR